MGLIVVALLLGLHTSHAARILALMTLPSPSHYIFNRALLIALAGRGHQVTVISANMETKPVPNLTNILLEDIYTKQTEEDYSTYSSWGMSLMMFNWGVTMCKKELATKGAQELLSYPSDVKFDLIISEVAWGECFFGFIQQFGSPPVIATSGIGIPPWLSLTMANPENPSYIPNFLLQYTEHMSFLERLHNFVIHVLVLFLYTYKYLPEQREVAAKYFKQDLPPFTDIMSNFTLVLVNTNFGLDVPRPLLPNVIAVGGMHIKTKSEPLPQDLKKYLDEAKDGFIFFSLGSNIRSDSLPGHKREALMQAFSELPQQVLWKFETDSLEGLPSNVRISKWFPQSDILAHPNIRMFISHCGMMSVMEAAYRGVPVVGIPLYLDQNVNLRKLVSKGGAVPLDYETLTKESVLNAIRTVLDNNSYSTAMKKLSAVYRDVPQSTLDLAVFWTEYVIRHGGAPHLRAASADLYWYQYLLLDVLLTLVVVLVTVLLVSFLILRAVVRLFGGSPKKLKTR